MSQRGHDQQPLQLPSPPYVYTRTHVYVRVYVYSVHCVQPEHLVNLALYYCVQNTYTNREVLHYRILSNYRDKKE